MEKLRITVDDRGKVTIEMDNYELKGVKGIEFNWEVGEVASHRIEFVTQVAKFQ